MKKLVNMIAHYESVRDDLSSIENPSLLVLRVDLNRCESVLKDLECIRVDMYTDFTVLKNR